MEHFGLIQIFLIFSQFFAVNADVILEVKIIHYNSNGKDKDGDCCDFLCIGRCDLKLRMCIDRPTGNGDVNHCAYFGPHQTGEYREKNSINFSPQIFASKVISSSDWQRGFKFKAYIKDVDHDADDKVDSFDKFVSIASFSKNFQGIRISGTSKSRSYFDLQYKAYCTDNFYGLSCEVNCVPHDDDTNGHYECDPQTGVKICNPGWETPQRNCTVKVDDCEDVDCEHSGTCVDLYEDFQCDCTLGFTGRYCEIEINECLSNPCENNGTCIDEVNSFTCTCADGYRGHTCHYHVCDVIQCANNGSCALDDNSDEAICLCPVAFTGTYCESHLCDVMQCAEGSTCDQDYGTCICPPGQTGSLCDVTICEHKVCANNASCILGQCVCPPQLTGSICELSIDECLQQPCLNDGICEDKLFGYECRCQLDYSGENCSEVVFTPSETGSSNGSADDVTSDTPGWAVGLIIILLFIVIIAAILYIVYKKRYKANKSFSSDYPETPTTTTSNGMSDFDNPMFEGDDEQISTVSGSVASGMAPSLTGGKAFAASGDSIAWRKGTLPPVPYDNSVSPPQSCSEVDANCCAPRNLEATTSPRAVENDYSTPYGVAFSFGQANVNGGASVSFQNQIENGSHQRNEQVEYETIPACLEIVPGKTGPRHSDYAVPYAHVSTSSGASNPLPPSDYYPMESGKVQRRPKEDIANYVTPTSSAYEVPNSAPVVNNHQETLTSNSMADVKNGTSEPESNFQNGSATHYKVPSPQPRPVLGRPNSHYANVNGDITTEAAQFKFLPGGANFIRGTDQSNSTDERQDLGLANQAYTDC